MAGETVRNGGEQQNQNTGAEALANMPSFEEHMNKSSSRGKEQLGAGLTEWIKTTMNRLIHGREWALNNQRENERPTLKNMQPDDQKYNRFEYFQRSSEKIKNGQPLNANDILCLVDEHAMAGAVTPRNDKIREGAWDMLSNLDLENGKNFDVRLPRTMQSLEDGHIYQLPMEVYYENADGSATRVVIGGHHAMAYTGKKEFVGSIDDREGIIPTEREGRLKIVGQAEY